MDPSTVENPPHGGMMAPAASSGANVNMANPGPDPNNVHMNNNMAGPNNNILGGKETDDVTGKIFIGGLSWQTTTENLRYYFEKFGEMTDVAIMVDKKSGKPRGFGFIKMADPAAAENIMASEHTIDGRLVDVKRALTRDKAPGPTRSESTKIFVGGLAADVSEKEFGDYFSEFGAIKDAVVMVDRNTGSSRGFGFVTFEYESSVDAVMNQQHEIMGKYVETKRAEPRDSRGPGMYDQTNMYAMGMGQNGMMMGPHGGGMGHQGGGYSGPGGGRGGRGGYGGRGGGGRGGGRGGYGGDQYGNGYNNHQGQYSGGRSNYGGHQMNGRGGSMHQQYSGYGQQPMHMPQQPMQGYYGQGYGHQGHQQYQQQVQPYAAAGGGGANSMTNLPQGMDSNGGGYGGVASASYGAPYGGQGVDPAVAAAGGAPQMDGGSVLSRQQQQPGYDSSAMAGYANAAAMQMRQPYEGGAQQAHGGSYGGAAPNGGQYRGNGGQQNGRADRSYRPY